ncbi:MAG: hypothetical protein ACLT8I_05060 [Blautia faecis]
MQIAGMIFQTRSNVKKI